MSFPFAALILILVFASLVGCGIAPPGRRPGDPDDARWRLPRRTDDRTVDLRPERRDDAGPGPRDRLFTLHGEPVSRGAAPRPRRRIGRRDHGRDQRQGRDVLRPRRRRRACPASCCSSRPPCDRSGSAARWSWLRRCFYALTFLPAVLGMLGPRVNALSVAGLRDWVRRRLGRPVGVAADRRPASRAGSAWPTESWRALRRARADTRVPAGAGYTVPAPRARASRTRPFCPAGIESREASVALSRDFRAGETSPIIVLATVAGLADRRANVQGVLRSQHRDRRRARTSTG